MFFRLSDTDNVIGGVAWRVYHHYDNDPLVNAKGLQPRFAVLRSRIFMGNRRASQNFLGNRQIQAMLGEIGGAFRLVVSNHNQTVYALCVSIKQNVYAIYQGCPLTAPRR
jgi:hypothetical protein